MFKLRYLEITVSRPGEVDRCVVKLEYVVLVYVDPRPLEDQSEFPSPLPFSFSGGPGPYGAKFTDQHFGNEIYLTHVFVVLPENLHRGRAERQADTKSPESCATTSQAGGTQEAA